MKTARVSLGGETSNTGGAVKRVFPYTNSVYGVTKIADVTRPSLYSHEKRNIRKQAHRMQTERCAEKQANDVKVVKVVEEF